MADCTFNRATPNSTASSAAVLWRERASSRRAKRLLGRLFVASESDCVRTQLPNSTGTFGKEACELDGNGSARIERVEGSRSISVGAMTAGVELAPGAATCLVRRDFAFFLLGHSSGITNRT